MRADMPRLIVDVPRRGSRFVPGVKTRLKVRRVPEPTTEFIDWETDEVEYFDLDSPSRIGRRKRHYERYSKTMGDYLKPAYRFLQKSVGKKWNAVWHQICVVAHSNTMLGKHLRDHVRDYVGLGRYQFMGSFFIDQDGVLRKKDPVKYVRVFTNPEKIELSELHILKLRNGFWFEVLYEKQAYEYERTYLGGKTELRKGERTVQVSCRRLSNHVVGVIKGVLNVPRTQHKKAYTDPLVFLVKDQHGFDAKVYVASKYRQELLKALSL